MKTLSDKRELLFKKYRLLEGCKKMILEQDEQFIKEVFEIINNELRTLRFLVLKGHDEILQAQINVLERIKQALNKQEKKQ